MFETILLAKIFHHSDWDKTSQGIWDGLSTLTGIGHPPESTVKRMYSNAVKHIYHSHQPYELAPHLYSLAEAAYRNMRENGTSQSIIVSGESGAGKTVAAKLILEYIAAVSVSGLVTE